MSFVCFRNYRVRTDWDHPVLSLAYFFSTKFYPQCIVLTPCKIYFLISMSHQNRRQSILFSRKNTDVGFFLSLKYLDALVFPNFLFIVKATFYHIQKRIAKCCKKSILKIVTAILRKRYLKMTFPPVHVLIFCCGSFSMLEF